MPYSLMPNITRPTVSIYTSWLGATPYEVEREITQKQERYLKSLPGLKSMTSSSRESSVNIALEFSHKTDMKKVLIDINGKLNEIKGYPTNVNRPIVKLTGENIPPVVYLFVKTKNSESIKHYYTYLLEGIIKRYERLDGVGSVDLVGGVAKQIQVMLNINQLAFYQITIDDVINALQNRNINISAGNIDYEQRNYRIRTIGFYEDIKDINNTVIKANDTHPIFLGDIAKVIDTYQTPTVPNMHNNDETISIQIRPTASANVLAMVASVRELTNTLNATNLREEGLYIDWGRDSSGFINDAIKLIKHDIVLGILLAAIILYVFLRSFSSILIISAIIPISILASFIILNALDRNLNVILLAGVSFAISMIIDSSIVVVENIYRHYCMGKRMYESCIDGTKEVVGAIFASTITTIAIFLPVIGLQDEVGQLFKDIALASTSALIISLLICLVVVPSLYYVVAKTFFIKEIKVIKQSSFSPKKSFDFIFIFVGNYLFNGMCFLVRAVLKNIYTRLLCIFSFLIFSIYIIYIFFPKLDYLPKGTQNFLIGYIQVPSGLSYKERLNILQEIYKKNAPYMRANGYDGSGEYPAIKDFYISAGTTSLYFYEISDDKNRVRELIKLMQDSIEGTPNISGQVVEQGIFSGSGLNESLDINIVGVNLDSVSLDARGFMRVARKYLPGARIRAIPSLDFGNREINLYPDIRSLAINGLSVKSFGNIVDVIVTGKKISEFRDKEGRTIDLVLQTSDSHQSPEDILYSLIYTPIGGILPLSSLAALKQDLGASQIRHFEQDRSILLNINALGSVPLQELIEIVQNKIIPELKKEGFLSENQVAFSGNASKLKKLANELSFGFALALFITYLLLVALYSNFLYPLIIIFTVPFALAGGFIGLKFVNEFVAPQNLDVLTMLGFIILVGSVVNNAILIVYQSLINLQQNISIYECVYQATASRIRPIYMSTLTSLLALAPLIFSSGAGSEIYRGLGAVIGGGILLSTIISVFVIPSLLIFVLKPKNNRVV